MIVATHQPIFLPWPGFFYKAMHSDCMVLLDGVQFPHGWSWMNRNRLKSETGELWLTVPVWKKGRGLQAIRDVEICEETDWRRKHLRSIRQNYAHAPYFPDYSSAIESIYLGKHRLLLEFNLDWIRFLWKELSVSAELVLQTDLGIHGAGTDLLARICERLQGDRLAIFPLVEKHLDAADMRRRGIELTHLRFQPPVYPQLRGRFLFNLSTLDLLLNCGGKSREILSRA